METKMMKNMVVLRNIPSNIVEEAYIVFKDNVKIHMRGKEEHEKIYAVSEAEMIVSDYISKIEKREDELGRGSKVIKEKYKRLKAFTIFLAMFSILSICTILLR